MQRSTKSGVSSVKSQKSKSTKSAKTQQTSTKTTAADAFDKNGVSEVRDRRVVIYEGRHSSLHSAEVKLKKNALYEILGIPPTATPDEIKKAWRKKALQLHPDKNFGGNKEELNAKLAQAKRAYEILSDPTKKKIYDHYGIDAVQTFEETECAPKWLWFMYSRLGRVFSCVVFLATCFCCCFCYCLCCFNCFCNCCCNHCCRGSQDDEDGYMEYDPEDARQQQAPPPKSRIASIINSISSKRIIKKKKKKNDRTQEEGDAGGEDIALNEVHPTSIRVEQSQTSGAAAAGTTTTNSKIYQSQRSDQKQIFSRSTQEVTNEEK